MELVELNPQKHAIVPLPGVKGLPMEERRLTVAVELVANPSIIFMHESSSSMIYLFVEGIQGVCKIEDGYKPPTWILEVTTSAREMKLGIDFSEVYKN
ncbi:hypothetical protein VNO77_18736 [Canavalia gladiata]|uniref:Uncharacterized protein n=1 Tax=Canavalia gladiata TaxID=3824 RepID=A0AAN9QKM8_CANGL